MTGSGVNVAVVLEIERDFRDLASPVSHRRRYFLVASNVLVPTRPEYSRDFETSSEIFIALHSSLF